MNLGFNNGVSRGILCRLLEQRGYKHGKRKLLYISFTLKAGASHSGIAQWIRQVLQHVYLRYASHFSHYVMCLS